MLHTSWVYATVCRGTLLGPISGAHPLGLPNSFENDRGGVFGGCFGSRKCHSGGIVDVQFARNSPLTKVPAGAGQNSCSPEQVRGPHIPPAIPLTVILSIARPLPRCWRLTPPSTGRIWTHPSRTRTKILGLRSVRRMLGRATRDQRCVVHNSNCTLSDTPSVTMSWSKTLVCRCHLCY